jgi:hypothetical protein
LSTSSAASASSLDFSSLKEENPAASLKLWRESGRASPGKKEVHFLDSSKVQDVLEMKYLGGITRQTARSTPEVVGRTAQANAAMKKLQHVWFSANLSTQSRFRVYEASVLSIVLDGQETTKLAEGGVTRLEAFHVKSCR